MNYTSTNQHRLCLVKGPWAYFTNIPLAEQSGCDWEDAPYQCNAGDPREDTPGQIITIAFRSPVYVEPNITPYRSVETINSGGHSWLESHDPDFPDIVPGTTVDEFIRLITVSGGEVYTIYNRHKTTEETH